MRLTWIAIASAVLLPVAAAPVRAADAAPLTLETRIPLGDISGRIDHLAFDPKRARLYVAERTGLFVPELDRLFVAIRAASGQDAGIWLLRPSP